MTKKEAKEIAKKILLKQICNAGYSIDKYTENADEAELICEQLYKIGERLAKVLGAEYTLY